MCVYVAACLDGWVCTTKTPDRNDLKLGTVVVLDIVSQRTDFGFRRAKIRVKFRIRIRVNVGLGLWFRVGVGDGVQVRIGTRRRFASPEGAKYLLLCLCECRPSECHCS